MLNDELRPGTERMHYSLKLLSLCFLIFISIPPVNAEEPKLELAPLFTNFETGANVRALAMEGDTLWIGLSNGIIKYEINTKENHEVFTTKSTLGAFLSNGIFKIKIDARGNKWFATYGGGLTKFDGNEWKVYTPYGMGSTHYGPSWVQFKEGEGLGDLWVYDILFEVNGKMWVATWNGVSLFDGKQFRTFTTKEGLPDKWVYAMDQEKDGSLWFGTEGGVSHFTGSRWTNYTHHDGLGAEINDLTSAQGGYPSSSHHSVIGKKIVASNPNYVLAIVIDKDNHKWFGTWGGGISRFDGKNWINYTKHDGLGGNFINCLAFDPQGLLWACTNGGASYFDGKNWKNLNENDGLLNNNVFSVAFDKYGNKYFGTWKGLSKLENFH